MKSAAKRQIEILSPEENHPALNAILGANPFVGLDATQVLGTLTKTLGHMMSDPAGVASRALQLALELGQIAGGSSSLAPEAGDKRFADPAWSEHPVFRRMMQSTSRGVSRCTTSSMKMRASSGKMSSSRSSQ